MSARDWRPAYIASLSEFGIHARAEKAAEISKVAVWNARKKDPEFEAQIKEALEIAKNTLVDEAIRRSRDGVRKYKFTAQGEPVMNPHTGEQYYEHEYSDTLMSKLLTAFLPEFKDKVEHSGEVRNVHMTLEEWDQRMKDAEQ